MPAPILITGAAGFVGTHLLHRLLADSNNGETVRLVGWHRPDTAPSVQHRSITWTAIDLIEPDAVASALAQLQPGAIYHLAGAAHVAQSWQQTYATYRANVLATQHILQGLRTASLAPRVLLSCSATVYAPQDRPITEADPLQPASPYATSKLAVEMMARRAVEEDQVPLLIARSFNHVGPGQDPSYVASGIARQIALIERGRQEPVLTMGSLEPRRDLTDVRDTVRAYTAMMASAVPGRPYNVCSGRALSIRALVETFVTRAQVPVRIVEDRARFRPNDAPMLVGDHSQLTADTGWQPEIPFAQTVDDLLAYWRAHLHDA